MDPSFLVLSLRGPSDAATTNVSGVREYKRRRYHTKSRRGCAACRQKRVKCDQAKPVCVRCTRNNRSCVYLDSVPDDADSGAPSKRSPSVESGKETSSDASSTGSRSPSGHRNRTVSLSPVSSPRALSVLYSSDMSEMGYRHSGTSIDELVCHFIGNGGTLIGNSLFSSTACRLWTTGDHAPYLRSAVLALTACHLRHHTKMYKQHALAELSQKAVALPQFQAALGKPLNPQRSDALILTSLVLGMLSWASMADEGPRAGWVYRAADDTSKLGWLTMMMGLRPVLMATFPFKDQSLMWKAFTKTTSAGGQAAGAPGGPVAGTGPDLDMDRIPERWRQLAEFSRMGDSADDIQYLIPPLTTLTAMRGQKPSMPEQLMPFFQVIGRLHPKFRRLLAHNDVRALWVIAYIFALMSHVDIWWCTAKIRRDLLSLRLFLGDLGLVNLRGHKGVLWKELLQELDTAATPVGAPSSAVVSAAATAASGE